MVKQSVTVNANSEVFASIRKHYERYIEPNNGEYIAFFARTKNLTVTAYTNSANDSYKIIFSGDNALEEAQVFDQDAKIKEAKKNVVTFWVDTNNQLGSDEVGTGDFFGPICVAAALVTKKDIQELRALGIDDSKKITDKRIRELVPSLIKKYRYFSLSCLPEKYNEMIAKGFNNNKIKAYLHNQALLKLSSLYKGNY
ncbi:MAG: DUF3378 domain-containing protein, partial [Bacilli bacterium]|nr:DUF3378 domain-containing protein [Bacilli bacterium]